MDAPELHASSDVREPISQHHSELIFNSKQFQWRLAFSSSGRRHNVIDGTQLDGQYLVKREFRSRLQRARISKLYCVLCISHWEPKQSWWKVEEEEGHLVGRTYGIVNSLFCPAHGCTNSRFIIAELQIPRTREHVFLGSVWRAH